MNNEEVDIDVLSFFMDDSDSNNATDSADELLDMLSTDHAQIKESTVSTNACVGTGDQDIDEDTKSQIAMLQAQIEQLKSKRSSPPGKYELKDKDIRINSSELTCKHGKTYDNCFFCSNVPVAAVINPDVKKSKPAAMGKCPAKRSDGHTPDDSPTDIFSVLPSADGVNTLDLAKKKRSAHKAKINNEDIVNPMKKIRVENKQAVTVPVTSKPEKPLVERNAHVFAGVEVSKPIMSSTVFGEKTKGRRLISISKIKSSIKGHDIEGDWVTVGVVVKKVVQKKSSSGKNFCVWHLSDLCLGTENNIVGFFLFGDCYNQHWKIQVGRTIALLNPEIMKQEDKYSDRQLSIKIDNPKKLMELGDAKFLGGCKGYRKSDGKPCTMYVNKRYGDYCEYHVQAAFKKAKSSRMDLQSGGRAPRKGKLLENLRKDISAGEHYYGGKTLTLQQEKVTKLAKESNGHQGLKSIMGHQIRLQAAIEFNEAKLKKEQGELVKDSCVTSFLKNNRNKLLKSSSDKCDLPSKGSSNVAGNVGKSTTSIVVNGSKINKEDHANQHLKQCDLNLFDNSHDKKDFPSKKVCSKLADKTASIPKKLKSHGENSTGGKCNPIIGRGLKTNDFLEFSIEDDFCYEKHTGEELLTTVPCLLKKPIPKDMKNDDKYVPFRSIQAKRNAISIVQSKGPIELEDPNIDIARKKYPKQLKNVEKVMEKYEESLCTNTKQKKKGALSGVLGHIDLNSEDGKKLLEQKSKHFGAVKLAEAVQEEKYFDALEKKEIMSEKLSSIYEIKVNGIACRECQYLAESQSELCKELNHAVAKIRDVVKRFFICKSCKQRCFSYNKLLPKRGCTRCGGDSFEKTSMGMERKGPLIGAETLEVRGPEKKFILGY